MSDLILNIIYLVVGSMVGALIGYAIKKIFEKPDLDGEEW